MKMYDCYRGQYVPRVTDSSVLDPCVTLGPLRHAQRRLPRVVLL